jgi:hypothetical protein
MAWSRSRGVDIAATRGRERWLIAAKGEGSLTATGGSHVLAMIGELLQRMDDPAARYSIALPEHRQFRDSWARLPALAKQRTAITALFMSRNGMVEEVA